MLILLCQCVNNKRRMDELAQWLASYKFRSNDPERRSRCGLLVGSQATADAPITVRPPITPGNGIQTRHSGRLELTELSSSLTCLLLCLMTRSARCTFKGKNDCCTVESLSSLQVIRVIVYISQSIVWEMSSCHSHRLSCFILNMFSDLSYFIIGPWREWVLTYSTCAVGCDVACKIIRFDISNVSPPLTSLVLFSAALKWPVLQLASNIHLWNFICLREGGAMGKS